MLLLLLAAVMGIRRRDLARSFSRYASGRVRETGSLWPAGGCGPRLL